MKIGFIGAGRVGYSLGRYFAEHGVQLTGYYSRQEEHARDAAVFTSSCFYDDIDKLVSDSDAVFITASDDQIAGIYERIARSDISKKNICHCSGALSSREAFPGIEKKGARGFSIHPLYPVSDRYLSWSGLADAFFCIEGGDGAQEWRTLLESIGLKARVISPDVKKKYHAAAAMASNLVIALIDEASEILSECGFGDDALAALSPLIAANIKNVLSRGCSGALTGPIERNDTGTVREHLMSLDEEQKKLYKAAGLRLIDTAQRKNPDRDYTQMRSLLS
ncbi:MAG: DUF2520 domain-containing protein [Lachnospiraceae bacterium]|nr:DUF2520 domain-containing protein [Lachnospiraceae bacterium]